MRGNSASNYKTDAWLKIKILLAVVQLTLLTIINSTI